MTITTVADLPVVLTVEEAADLLRIGRTAAYEAARRGDIPVIRVGRSLRVPRHRLERMLGIDGDGPARDRAASETTPATGKESR